jgi:Family of unknown function (DUF6153)
LAPWLPAVTTEGDYSERGVGRLGMMRHQWLLFVIIVGLVGTHPLVPRHADHTKAMASATPAAHPHPVPVISAAVPSPVVPHAGCCDPMDMIGHFCLAVLTAITAFAFVLILVALWRRLRTSGFVRAMVGAIVARAPPSGVPRLTRICVLRC